MGVIRNTRTGAAKAFLTLFAVGFAMVLGSFLGEVAPLARAAEGDGAGGISGGPVTLDEEAWAALEKRLGELPDAGDNGRGEKVMVFPVEGNIDLGLSSFLERSLMDTDDVRLVILDINTFGGRVDAAVQMRDELMDLDVPTVAYVHPRGISAGALITLACDAIVVTPGASLGAATPVQIEGGEATSVDKKYVSYLRGEFRSTAEAQGRDGAVAEAMVDSQVVVEDLVTAEELLTLDSGQALDHGIADFQAKDLATLLDALHLGEADQRKPEISWAETMVRFLTDPIVGGLLMSIGMLGIAIELYSPGVGLPGGVGVTCLALFFFGHFMTHLAGIEEIVLIAIGSALLALEIFVIPGFGVAGISGLLVLALGLVLALLGLDLQASFETGAIWTAVIRVLAALTFTIFAFIGFLYVAPRSRYTSWLVLKEKVGGTATDREIHEPDKPSDEELMGQEGVAVGDLRPSGVARFGDARIDVVTEGDYVVRDSRVRVIEIKGNRVVVRKVEDDNAGR